MGGCISSPSTVPFSTTTPISTPFSFHLRQTESGSSNTRSSPSLALEIGEMYCIPTIKISDRPGLLFVSSSQSDGNLDTIINGQKMQMVCLTSMDEDDGEVTVELLPRIVYSELDLSKFQSLMPDNKYRQPDEIARCSGKMLKSILYASLSPTNKTDGNLTAVEWKVQVHSYLVPRCMGTLCDIFIKGKWYPCQIIWVTPTHMLLLCLSRSVLLQVPLMTTLISLRNKWSSSSDKNNNNNNNDDQKSICRKLSYSSNTGASSDDNDEENIDDSVSGGKFHYEIKENVWNDGNLFVGDIKNIMRIDNDLMVTGERKEKIKKTEEKKEEKKEKEEKKRIGLPGELFIETSSSS